MPGIKTSIYDGVLWVEGAESVDFQRSSGAHAVATNPGTKVVTVDANGANLTAGMQVVNGRTGNAIGTVVSSTGTTVTFENGTKEALELNDPLDRAPKFEIVAIQAITDAFEIGTLVPVHNGYPGTRNSSDDAAWETDGQAYSKSVYGTRTVAAGGETMSLAIGVGITLEGRWKFITGDGSKAMMVYIKAAPSQTF